MGDDWTKSGAGANPIRLYIVEDYHLFRMGLVSALSAIPSLQFVGEAESAEEALAELDSLQVDVLILDLGLPGMNGIQMAQEVRKRWPHMKIVIITSHNQPAETTAALGAGANAYALKDIKPERLAQVIETVHEGAAWLDPSIASMVLERFALPQGTAAPTFTFHAGESSPTVETQAPAEELSSGVPYELGGPVLDLTERERDVLQLIVQGKNNQDISETLNISIHTTKAHVGNILAKLSVNDRVQAAIKAIKENLV